MDQPNYSIIIPVYNSEQTLEELFFRLNSVFSTLLLSFEIIFVDDGSEDKSWNVLKKIKSQNTEAVKIIQLSKNFGQHNAVLCGLRHATGNFIITLDDDLQHPPEEIPKLIETFKLQDSDLVYGVDPSSQPLHRRIPSGILRSYTKNVMKKTDDWSAFRLMTKKLSDHLAKHQHGFFILDQAAFSFTNKIASVKVKFAKRKTGDSGYSLGKLLSLWSRLIIIYIKFPVKMLSNKPTFIIKEKLL